LTGVRPVHSHKTVSRTPACPNVKLMRMCPDVVIKERSDEELKNRLK
jgi:hypothetical protein